MNFTRDDWAVRITFTETGSTFEGKTATEALERLAETQWNVEDRENIKRALAWRWFVMSQDGDPRTLHELMSDDKFVRTLHSLGFVQVEWRKSAPSGQRDAA